jgi:ABC-type lipoprotein export system ATPase subunit
MVKMTSVTKTFNSGRGTVTALDSISLSIEAGAFAAITGKSGSGKSTLLNCLGGLEPPEKGSIICFGAPLYSLRGRELSLFQRRHIGFIFQRGNLLSYLTVAENIGFPLTLNGIVGNARLKRIEELLDRIELSSAAKALPHELSMGEAQRVATARAIAHNPKMLLADEPTANLDTETGQRIVELMRKLGRDFGCTIIMATHDMDITGTANSIFCLKDGRILEEEK